MMRRIACNHKWAIKMVYAEKLKHDSVERFYTEDNSLFVVMKDGDEFEIGPRGDAFLWEHVVEWESRV